MIVGELISAIGWRWINPITQAGQEIVNVGSKGMWSVGEWIGRTTILHTASARARSALETYRD